MVLIAGGQQAAVEALRAALAAAGVSAAPVTVGDATQRADLVVINPGSTWEGSSWRATLESLYAWTEVALRLLGGRGAVVACGPRVVSAPGAGYPEYVKARIALRHWAAEVEAADGAVAPAVLWGADARALAPPIIGRVAAVTPLRSAGGAVSG